MLPILFQSPQRRIIYFLRATFGTDLAAPLPASLPVDLGGPFTVTDTESKLSQSASALVSAGGKAVPAFGDPGIREIARPRTIGHALLTKMRFTTGSTQLMFGWDPVAGSTIDAHAFYKSGTGTINIRVGTANVTLGSLDITADTDYLFLIVLLNPGAVYLHKLASASSWTVDWVDNSQSQATLIPSLANHSAFVATDRLDGFDLGRADARFSANTGLITARLATNSAGDTITHAADAIVQQTLTAATGVDKDLGIRMTDDNNGWFARMNQAGSTVKLIEKVAGVETSRGSVATTFTNGVDYILTAIFEGNTIRVMVDNTTKITYSSASFQATATTAKAVFAGTEFKSYPRTIALRSDL